MKRQKEKKPRMQGNPAFSTRFLQLVSRTGGETLAPAGVWQPA